MSPYPDRLILAAGVEAPGDAEELVRFRVQVEFIKQRLHALGE